MFPTIFLVVYGQLVIKWRVEQISRSLPDSGSKLSGLVSYLTDPYIVSAYAAALGGSIAWIFVVERYDLSQAFPIYVGLTIALVALGGVFMFDEALSLQRMLSILLILAGVVVGSRA